MGSWGFHPQAEPSCSMPWPDIAHGVHDCVQVAAARLQCGFVRLALCALLLVSECTTGLLRHPGHLTTLAPLPGGHGPRRSSSRGATRCCAGGCRCTSRSCTTTAPGARKGGRYEECRAGGRGGVGGRLDVDGKRAGCQVSADWAAWQHTRSWARRIQLQQPLVFSASVLPTCPGPPGPTLPPSSPAGCSCWCRSCRSCLTCRCAGTSRARTHALQRHPACCGLLPCASLADDLPLATATHG